MPFAEFLDKFVTATETPTPHIVYVQNENVKKETDMYQHLIAHMNAVLKHHKAVDTSKHRDAKAAVGQKMSPDFLVYDNMFDMQGRPTHFDKAKLGGEDKLLADPFDDNTNNGFFEPKAQGKDNDTVGQIVRYIEELHAQQHRTLSFFLFLNTTYFRVIRADRDEFIVTERRVWQQKDGKLDLGCLVEFLHRFDNLTAKEQGLDPTVRPLQPEHAAYEQRARTALEKHVHPSQRSEPILEMDVPCSQELSGFRNSNSLDLGSTQQKAWHPHSGDTRLSGLGTSRGQRSFHQGQLAHESSARAAGVGCDRPHECGERAVCADTFLWRGSSGAADSDERLRGEEVE